MNRIFALVFGLGIAALVSGWTGYNSFSAELNNGCVAQGGPAEACECFATAISDEYSFVNFVGLGPFRPLLNEDAIDATAAAAATSCAPA